MNAPSHLTVDLDAYAHNLAFIRHRIPPTTRIMAIVKADGYGLGAVPLATRALDEGISDFGVATVAEGIALRETVGNAAILVLTQPPEEALGAALEHDLRLLISDVSFGERLGELAKKAKTLGTIHCKIDTGMGRQGFNLETAAENLLRLTRISYLDVEGIATHFSTADISEDFYSENQIKTFRNFLKEIDHDGIPYEITHAANSAAIINVNNCELDMVRPGLMTYGVWPTDTPLHPSPLHPVARWTSTIVLIKPMPGGVGIGYGRTYKTPRPERIAIVPVGYADGYPYHLSNRAEVLVRGLRCAVRGRVSMDMIAVDISGVRDAATGDVVTLIGKDVDQEITVEELAKKADTIPYEILTGIGNRVARRYLP